MINTTYFNIAGFNIKIVFRGNLIRYGGKDINKIMFLNNEGFILKNKPQNIDFLLDIIKTKELLITNNNNYSSMRLYKQKGRNSIETYSYISRIQFVLILRHIIEQLIKNSGFVLHCSACNMNGKAVIFLGQSGAGKSTIVRLLKDDFPILCDDEGYIKKEGGVFYFYQGPFLEKKYDFQKNSTRYRLDKIYFLHQGSQCKITKLSKRAVIIKKIASQAWTENRNHLQSKISTLLLFTSKFKAFYTLHFSKDKESLLRCLTLQAPFN